MSSVAAIMEQLLRGGPLMDPRPPSDDPQVERVPLPDYVAREIQRSFDRVSRQQTYDLPPGVEIPTPADFREAVRLLRAGAAALRKVARFDDHRAIIPEMERIAQELAKVQQFPPEGADVLKHRCAGEAFDLMTFFAANLPTSTEGGPFWTIAALLHEAVTGEPHTDVSMKRACDYALNDRKQFHPNAFRRP
jgi:hypothetical protein